MVLGFTQQQQHQILTECINKVEIYAYYFSTGAFINRDDDMTGGVMMVDDIGYIEFAARGAEERGLGSDNCACKLPY